MSAYPTDRAGFAARTILKSVGRIAAVPMIVGSVGYSQMVFAQQGVIDEVVITGSYIKRRQQLSTSSPIFDITSEDLFNTGITTMADITANMTFNSGSEFNFDQSDQDRTVGTSQMNLRGLGLSSTLVLVNGRRQTLSASSANGGDTFVDINSLMPLIMVERVETLKDGAAALYGTEAVAGVVNFITRNDFEGFDLQADYQFTTQSDDMDDLNLQAIFGAGSDSGHLVAAVSYLERSEMTTCDRDFSCTPLRTNSSFGNPGTFIPLADINDGPFAGTPAFSSVVDPDCPPELNSGSRCLYNFGPNNALVPETQRFNAFTRFRYDVSERVEAFGELSFARSTTDAPNSPSLPLLGFGSIIVPASHPDNILGVNSVWLGRPFADAGRGPGGNRNINVFDDTTARAMLGLSGSLGGDSNWTWEGAFSYSENRRQYTLRGTLASAFLDALQGLGGPDCSGTEPGENGCQYFNPFGSALDTSPNSTELVDFITTDNPTEEETSLLTWDFHATGDLFELPAGAVGLAVGAQYREDTRSLDSSPDAEREDIFFFFGGVDAEVDRDVWAIFAESLVPLYQSDSGGYLELQLAARYEDYGDGLDSLDPKIGVLYQPTENVGLRASWGTSFRAPSLLQIGQEQISFDAFSDAISGEFSFVPSVANPNPNLEPEQSDFFNVGATVRVNSNWSGSFDYYNIQYEDLLTADNTQVLVAEEFNAYQATCVDPDNLIGCDTSALNSEQILRDPQTLAPQRVFRNRFNAAAADTSGVDLGLNYGADVGNGVLSWNTQATYVIEYKLQTAAGGEVIEAAGSRNELLSPLARSMPEWRVNSNVTYYIGKHGLAATLRFIDSYYDDQNDTDIDSFTTLDLQYSYAFSDDFRLTMGVNNALDEDPPAVNSETGYDSKAHSPMGALAYFRVSKSF